MEMRAQFARGLRALLPARLVRTGNGGDNHAVRSRSRAAAAASAAASGIGRAAALFEALEPRQLLSTYYVSPAGSDSAAGTSITAPWKTITRLNSQALRAGDTILFEG